MQHAVGQLDPVSGRPQAQAEGAHHPPALDDDQSPLGKPVEQLSRPFLAQAQPRRQRGQHRSTAVEQLPERGDPQWQRPGRQVRGQLVGTEDVVGGHGTSCVDSQIAADDVGLVMHHPSG